MTDRIRKKFRFIVIPPYKHHSTPESGKQGKAGIPFYDGQWKDGKPLLDTSRKKRYDEKNIIWRRSL
jgi:hypothetical protein